MKKFIVFAVLLVVIGVICVLFFGNPGGDNGVTESDEKPWTVGSVTSTTVVEETTEADFEDAVSAFSDYVNHHMRDSLHFLSKEQSYNDDLKNSVIGLYVYDMDGDLTEELSLVRVGEDGVYLDLYEFRDKKVFYADSIRLVLDSMDSLNLSLNPTEFAHLASRMTIVPHGVNRYFCLTTEQETKDGVYNAYTIVFSYEKEKLSVKKSFRLRQKEDVLTLMCTDNVTLLYSSATSGEDGTSAAEYNTLDEAFKTEFAKVGLAAPQLKVVGGKLTQYKVTPVENEQHLYSVSLSNAALSVAENGFLQSFVLPE